MLIPGYNFLRGKGALFGIEIGQNDWNKNLRIADYLNSCAPPLKSSTLPRLANVEVGTVNALRKLDYSL